MKAISSLYVKFREKISALFARRLQSIKGTSFLHLPHSKLRVKPLNFGGGGLISGELISRRLTTGCVFWFKGRWPITGGGGGGGERGRFCISYKNGNKSAT